MTGPGGHHALWGSCQLEEQMGPQDPEVASPSPGGNAAYPLTGQVRGGLWSVMEGALPGTAGWLEGCWAQSVGWEVHGRLPCVCSVPGFYLSHFTGASDHPVKSKLVLRRVEWGSPRRPVASPVTRQVVAGPTRRAFRGLCGIQRTSRSPASAGVHVQITLSSELGLSCVALACPRALRCTRRGSCRPGHRRAQEPGREEGQECQL